GCKNWKYDYIVQFYFDAHRNYWRRLSRQPKKDVMSEPKKLLIITYYWPPAGGPGVQRWLKFVKYLPDFDIQPIVYIPENPTYPIVDVNLEHEVSEKAIILKHKIFEPYQLASFFSKNKTKKISSGIIPN